MKIWTDKIRKWFKEIRFRCINLLNDSLTVAKDIVAEDLVKIEQFFVSQYVKTLENKYAAYSSSGISVRYNALKWMHLIFLLSVIPIRWNTSATSVCS